MPGVSSLGSAVNVQSQLPTLAPPPELHQPAEGSENGKESQGAHVCHTNRGSGALPEYDWDDIKKHSPNELTTYLLFLDC